MPDALLKDHDLLLDRVEESKRVELQAEGGERSTRPWSIPGTRLSCVYSAAILPAAPRGSEASVTLPLDEALRTPPIRVPVSLPSSPGEEDDKRRGKARRTPLSERLTADPREAYGRISGQPRLRGGQLAANSRSQVGARQRSRVLGWFDTATGRYLSLSRAGTDGREWVTVAPADPATLRTRLGEMVNSVSDGTR